MSCKDVLTRMCTLICSTFYPDEQVVDMVLQQSGIEAETESSDQNVTLFRLAVGMVRGYVENSRSENGISVSVNYEAVQKAIRFWAEFYGADVNELCDNLRVLEDGSNLW